MLIGRINVNNRVLLRIDLFEMLLSIPRINSIGTVIKL